MIRALYIVFLFTVSSLTLMAQDKLFTLEDLISGGKNYKVMSPEELDLWWDNNTLVNSNERKRPLKYPQVVSRDYNIYVKLNEDAEEYQLTTDGTREVIYGEPVHRNEFGIDDGIFMSPDMSAFAFYRMDQSMVTDYPQVNIFADIATYAPDKYPMAGKHSHEVTIGVCKVVKQNGKPSTEKDIVWLTLGDVKDRYFTNISWSPDSKKIYLISIDRAQKVAALEEYSAQTGEKLRIIDIEKDEKYVEPQHPIAFLPWDNTRFIHWSQRDGYWHLYLYDAETGKEIKQLTKGNFVVQKLIGFCAKLNSVIITSNELSPLQSNILAVNVDTGERKLLDNGDGVHTATMSDDGTMILDRYTSPTVEAVYSVIDLSSGLTKEYHRSSNPWQGYATPIFKQGMIKATDEVTDLYYRMVIPPDFDEKKKYPTIVYVYNGPHVHLVDASLHWKSRGWETYMAQKGYIVFALDGRGSENRGKEFEQSTYHQLGQVEMLDQMQGVSFLRTLPYVDADRMGIHGWSFGGFMTLSLLTNYPDVFKVGVAGGPVTDWQWYEVMYGERYMGTPQENPEGYAKTSVIDKAGKLKCKLQIIFGMNDPVVVPQHALRFINACNESGVHPDMYVYPGQEHNMKGRMAIHLHERISQYFDDNLK